MALNLLERLKESPLFQGLTTDNLLQIIGQTKFTFSKFAPGQVIKSEGEACRNICIILNGQATSIAYAADHGYSLEEHVEAPCIIQPECLSGLSQQYTQTLVAATSCDTVEIGKNDLMHISDEFIIFRINLINAISAIAQKAERKLWQPMPTDIRERIALFIRMHCAVPSGEKTMRVKMTRLAQEIGTGRLAVSEALNAMQDNGLLRFSRGIISVKNVEMLH